MNGVVLLNGRYGIRRERYVSRVLFLCAECCEASAVQRLGKSNGYIAIDGRREKVRIFWRRNKLGLN